MLNINVSISIFCLFVSDVYFPYMKIFPLELGQTMSYFSVNLICAEVVSQVSMRKVYCHLERMMTVRIESYAFDHNASISLSFHKDVQTH